MIGRITQGGVASFEAVSVLCDLYFNVTFRKRPELGLFYPYYRLVERYRNIEDRICHKTILSIGFVSELKPEQLNVIQTELTQLASGTSALSLEEDSILEVYVAGFWNQILANKTIDVMVKSKATNVKTWLDLESIKHTQVWDSRVLL